MSERAHRDGLDIEQFRPFLMGLARRGLERAPRSKVEASDVVQDTLLEAHRKRDQFRGSSKAEMAGWLRQLLLRTMTDAFRAEVRGKRDVRRVGSLQARLEESSAQIVAILVDGQSTPSKAVGRHEDALLLARALARLPKAQSEAVVLRHCKGCSLAEISQQLGRTTPAVAGLLKRGLHELRILLEERR